MDKKYTVSGMTCSACSARVERCVNKIEGVNKATVNLISGTLSVDMEGDLTNEIFSAVKNEGYGIKEGVSLKRGSERARALKRRLFISLPLVVLLMFVSMGNMIGLPMPNFLHDKLVNGIIQALLCIPVIIVNYQYFTVGFKKLFTGAPNMDSLIAMGSSVSFLYSLFAVIMLIFGREEYSGSLFFEGSAMILTFITIGKFLEEKSKNKTMSAVEKLIDLAPDMATVEREGKEITIKSVDLSKGDIIILKDGDRVPADGEIIFGDGWADESVITGESLPVYKKVGDKVVCGSKFTGGYVKFKAVSVGEDSTIFKIVKLVEEANSTKVPIAKIADKVAGVFVPSVIGIALLAFLGWLIIGGKDVRFAINIAVSVLVVSCPCALGLATPAALMAGTGKAAENGILVKSGEALQNLEKIEVVVLDKTGTITSGKPEVAVYRHIDRLSDEFFLGICSSVEKKSSHVLGKPIIELAEKQGAENFEVDNFTAVAGEGVKAVVDKTEVSIGNKKMMNEEGVDLSEFKEETDSFEKEGATVLYCSFDKEIVGFIAVKDKIKPTSGEAIDQLKKSGVKVVMLTGDSEGVASSVASELGIEYRAGVLPEDKHSEVEKFVNEGKKTVMVGDGVNDAPALTSATVGMAIGAGTDVAIESADVVLIRNELSSVPEALRLGKAVMRNIKENLFWAFFYNIILIPIACGALYPIGITFNPMLSSAAMSLSSLFVVGNALRLRYFKFKENKKENRRMSENSVTVLVDGMMCDHCRKRVEDTLSAFGKASVDLSEKKGVIEDCSAGDEEIKSAIEKAGYSVLKIER